jgi:hypothetical protein
VTRPHDMTIEGNERMVNDLINEQWPGVETMIDLTPRRTEAPVGNARDRGHTRLNVLNCHDCNVQCVDGVRGEDNRQPMQWQPKTSTGVLPNSAAVVVIGPVEVWDAVRTTIRAERMRHVAYIPLVACETFDEDQYRRHPNDAERNNCMGHVTDQLWTANATGVLLVGRDAANVWRHDLTLERNAGTIGVLWGQFVTTIIDHPETVKSYRGKGEWTRWKDQIHAFCEAVKSLEEGSSSTWVESTSRCVECGTGDVDWVDPDGLPWCKGHRNERWMDARTRTGVGGPVQGGLF